MSEKPRPKPKGPNLAQQIKALKGKQDRLERELREIRDVLNTQDNWHSETKDWLGKEVYVCFRNGHDVYGTLLWTDRYNICLLINVDVEREPTQRRRVCTKGGIDFMECVG